MTDGTIETTVTGGHIRDIAGAGSVVIENFTIYNGTIKIWLVDEQKLIAALCLRVGSNLTKKEWAHYIGSDTPWQPSCRDLPRDIHPNWRTPG